VGIGHPKAAGGGLPGGRPTPRQAFFKPRRERLMRSEDFRLLGRGKGCRDGDEEQEDEKTA